MPSTDTGPAAASDQARERGLSFEASLAARSAEFEAERNKPTHEDEDNENGEIDNKIAQNEIVSANAVNDAKGKAKTGQEPKGKGKAAKAKMMMNANPFAAMYNPYAMMAMQQQQMYAAQQSWADAEQDGDDWWYLRFFSDARFWLISVDCAFSLVRSGPVRAQLVVLGFWVAGLFFPWFV